MNILIKTNYKLLKITLVLRIKKLNFSIILYLIINLHFLIIFLLIFKT